MRDVYQSVPEQSGTVQAVEEENFEPSSKRARLEPVDGSGEALPRNFASQSPMMCIGCRLQKIHIFPLWFFFGIQISEEANSIAMK